MNTLFTSDDDEDGTDGARVASGCMCFIVVVYLLIIAVHGAQSVKIDPTGNTATFHNHAYEASDDGKSGRRVKRLAFDKELGVEDVNVQTTTSVRRKSTKQHRVTCDSGVFILCYGFI